MLNFFNPLSFSYFSFSENYQSLILTSQFLDPSNRYLWSNSALNFSSIFFQEIMKQFTSKSASKNEVKGENKWRAWKKEVKNAERWKITTHTLRVCRLDIQKDIDILSLVAVFMMKAIWIFCIQNTRNVQNKLIIIMSWMELCFNMQFSHLNNIIDS